MSRKTMVTLLLIIVSALLAVALFIAGAIWRGRFAVRSSVAHSGRSLVLAELTPSVPGIWKEHCTAGKRCVADAVLVNLLCECAGSTFAKPNSKKRGPV